MGLCQNLGATPLYLKDYALDFAAVGAREAGDCDDSFRYAVAVEFLM